MKVQILGPHDDVPEAVRFPVVVALDNNFDTDDLRIMLEDGGVWALPRSAMHDMEPGQYSAGQLFATHSSRFIFKERRRSRYARRT